MVASARGNGRDLETIHYELAAEVKALREKLLDSNQEITRLALEARQPKPLPWGAISSVVGATAAVILSIGALIHQNIAQRIDDNVHAIDHVEKSLTERVTDFDTRHARREDTLEPKLETEIMKQEISQMVPRVEHDARLAALPPYATKAEFDATVSSIFARQLRNEAFIEDARKNETVNRRIDQLYELYRQLQNQVFQVNIPLPVAPQYKVPLSIPAPETDHKR